MINKITIKNFKSISNAIIDLTVHHEEIICFLGKNGSGKTTVFKAIKYFFDNISKKYSEESVIDCHNPYTQKCTISISFDVKLLRIKAEKNKALAEKFKKIDNYFLNIFLKMEIILILTILNCKWCNIRMV